MFILTFLTFLVFPNQLKATDIVSQFQISEKTELLQQQALESLKFLESVNTDQHDIKLIFEKIATIGEFVNHHFWDKADGPFFSAANCTNIALTTLKILKSGAVLQPLPVLQGDLSHFSLSGIENPLENLKSRVFEVLEALRKRELENIDIPQIITGLSMLFAHLESPETSEFEV